MTSKLTLVRTATQDLNSISEQLARQQIRREQEQGKAQNTKMNLVPTFQIKSKVNVGFPQSFPNAGFFVNGSDQNNFTAFNPVYLPPSTIGKIDYITNLSLGVGLSLAFPVGYGANHTANFDLDLYLTLAQADGNVTLNQILWPGVANGTPLRGLWQEQFGTLSYRNGAGFSGFGLKPANRSDTLDGSYNQLYNLSDTRIPNRGGTFTAGNQNQLVIDDYDTIIHDGKNLVYQIVANGNQFNALSADQQSFLNGQKVGFNNVSPLESVIVIGQMYFVYTGVLASY